MEKRPTSIQQSDKSLINVVFPNQQFACPRRSM